MKLTIEKAIYGGDGLGRHEGKAVFVPGALPGETVDVRITQDRGGFARAELLTVLEPSPERVAPGCPYYGACGGCQYQHASAPLQLALKASILEESLQRAGVRDLPTIGTHAASPWGYRNRIRLHVTTDGRVGYLRRNSNAMIAVDTCPIAAPPLQSMIPVLQAALQAHRAGAWCSAVTAFVNDSGDAILLTLEQRDGARVSANALRPLCDELARTVPALRGAGIVPSAARPASRGKRPAPVAALEDGESGAAATGVWGDSALIYTVAGRAYRVSLGAFFQGNRLLVDTLMTVAVGTAGGNAKDGEAAGSAWDLFSGVGLFAAALAASGTQVTAVEGSPASLPDLRHNVPPARVLGGSVQQLLLSGAYGATPDRVLLDPPRAGLGVEAAHALAAVRSQSITYVSCDPATLARDLRVLVDAGYNLSQLDLIDMFPQTFHMETVAKLRMR